MKNTVLLLGLLLVLLGPAAHAQGPSWRAAIAVGQRNVQPRKAVPDGNGNVYVVGYFTGTATFGNLSLTSQGGYDIFVAKYRPATNTYTWVQRAGGTSMDIAYGLAVSGTSVYVVGSYDSPTADFGATTLTNTSLRETFVTKLTDAGTSSSFTWTQRVGSATGTGLSNTASAVAVSGTSVYVAGFLSGSFNYGTTNLQSQGEDGYVAKLTDAGSTGSFVWAQRAGGTGSDRALDVAVNGTSVYVAGLFQSPTMAVGGTTLTNAGSSAAFVAKLTDAGGTGSYAWAQAASSIRSTYGYAVAVSGSSVYLGGQALGQPTTFGAASIAGGGAFVAKLTDAGSTGSFTWAQGTVSGTSDRVLALVAGSGSVYAAGDFGSAAGVVTSFGATTLTSAGMSDAFVAKLADAGSTGSFAWALGGGGTDFEDAFGLALSGGSLYVVGSANSTTASFGAATISIPTAAATVGGAFLASLDTNDAGALATLPATLPGLALYPNPAHGTATVRLPTGTGPAALTLLDALGRVVRTAVAPAGIDYPLSLAGLAPGVYALRVRAGEAQAVRQVVVE